LSHGRTNHWRSTTLGVTIPAVIGVAVRVLSRKGGGTWATLSDAFDAQGGVLSLAAGLSTRLITLDGLSRNCVVGACAGKH
jgi:hypothetical protein